MKIIFHIKAPFTLLDMRTWDKWKFVYKHAETIESDKKLAYFLRNLQTSRANNSAILRIK